MATFGLTLQGMNIPTLNEIREDLKSQFRRVFGASLPLNDTTIEGQIIGILAERLSLLWELSEVVYSSQNPNAATGLALEQLCTLTGTFREPASYSVVTLLLTGDPTTVVTADSHVSTTSTSAAFKTNDPATLVVADPWTALTPYAAGDIVTNVGQIYRAWTTGVSGNNTSPTLDREPQYTARPIDFAAPLLLVGPSSAAPDGSIVWIWIGAGTAFARVNATAISTGPITAVAYDLNEIENPIAGWNAATNELDATLGQEEMLDEELRMLREQELSAQGSTTVNAIRAEVGKLDDVQSVTVFVNNTALTDGDGMPPHSVEALVRGGADQQIYNRLLDSVAAGILTTGTETGSATDEQGFDHVVRFSRPVEIPIYVIANITIDAARFPADGAAQIKLAITTYGDAQSCGKNAVSSAIAARVFDVPGVLEVNSCYIDDAPTPTTSTTIPIALRQLATYDTSRIIVNTTPGTP